MKSLSTSSRNNPDKGFTIVEIIIGIGLFAIIIGFSLLVSFDVYRGDSFRTEREVVISILQKARSRATNNINESPHGVRFENDKYTIFQGESYEAATLTEEVGEGYNIDVTNGEVVFEQLTGNRYSGLSSIDLSSQGKSSTININEQGRIDY